MEDLLKELKELIPVVIIISSFLLPAFLKKKKDDKKKKKKTMLGPGPATKTAEPTLTEIDDMAREEKNLEDQIRKYFTETKDQKAAQAADARQPAESAPPKTAASVEPPAPTADLEPFAPAAPAAPRMPTISPAPYPRPAGEAGTRPAPARKGKPLENLKPLKKTEPVSSLEAASAEDAYITDTDAYSQFDDAYDIHRDVHDSAIELGDMSRDLSTLKKEGIPRKKREEKVPAAIGGWVDTPPLTEMSRADLRRAIIIKEVLGRPVSLRAPGSDLLW
jgi:hypothetical protein